MYRHAPAHEFRKIIYWNMPYLKPRFCAHDIFFPFASDAFTNRYLLNLIEDVYLKTICGITTTPVRKNFNFFNILFSFKVQLF